jgi:hypothetical protein
MPAMIEQTRDASAAMLHSLTEDEMAIWRRYQGYRVSAHHGRFWMEMPPGFLQPVHLVARFSRQEASAPTALSLGFRAVLSEIASEAANGALPVHVLSDLAGYTIERLSSNRRNHLRRCYKRAAIVQITGSAPLRQQGYEVFQSALKRTGYGRPQRREDYLAGLEIWCGNIDRSEKVAPARRVVLGAFVNDSLGGYLGGFAVDGTAYIEEIYISTEALSNYVGIGLVFEFVQVCRRSEGIAEVIYGPHSREDESLCTFKQSIGFPVRKFPTRIRVLPIVAQLLRWRYPHKYYRWTGVDEQVSTCPE